MKRRRRKRNAYPPGYIPQGAVAWCALHERGINAKYMRTKRCISKSTGACQHLRWDAPETGAPEHYTERS